MDVPYETEDVQLMDRSSEDEDGQRRLESELDKIIDKVMDDNDVYSEQGDKMPLIPSQKLLDDLGLMEDAILAASYSPKCISHTYGPSLSGISLNKPLF